MKEQQQKQQKRILAQIMTYEWAVIAIAKNTILEPGQQTSFSGLGSVTQGTNPVCFKLTYDWL
jgi:hypothetical protein